MMNNLKFCMYNYLFISISLVLLAAHNAAPSATQHYDAMPQHNVRHCERILRCNATQRRNDTMQTPKQVQQQQAQQQQAQQQQAQQQRLDRCRAVTGAVGTAASAAASKRSSKGCSECISNGGSERSNKYNSKRSIVEGSSE